MIERIIKRDGTIEDFVPSKLNRWAEWATQTLGNKVDWPSVVLETVSNLPSECTSEFLQSQLIKTCLDFDTWSYNRMAGRLYAAQIHKNLYNNKMPTVKELHRKLQALGFMEYLDYSDEEYEQVEKLVNHKQDFKYAYYQIHVNLTKYAIADRVNRIYYESPQYMYMRMAMALSEDQPKERRMQDVAKFYEHLSNNRINAPTPNHINLGTPLRGYSSCCLYNVDDDVKSIAAGNLIAYTMTYMSAGIGAYLQTRSVGDPVRKGAIEHMGKLPYYRNTVASVKANTQNGRGGACTMYFNIFDPEIETLLNLKNPMSTEDKKIRGLDYSWGGNKFIARKAARNEQVFLFNIYTAPDLYKALYSGDQSEFERLYEKYEADENFKKTYVNARDLIIQANNQWYETGRVYEHHIDEINRHTPFKETIYMSNLCFTGDTLVAVADGRNAIRIDQLASESNGKIKIPVYSARKAKGGKNYWKTEIKNAIAFKTGTKPVVKVVLSNGDTFECTEDHRLALASGGYIEAKDSVGHQLEGFFTSLGGINDEEGEIYVVEIINENKVEDVYDLTVDDNHNFYIITGSKDADFLECNGVLVHNCSEILEPNKPYYDIQDLYRVDHHNGEVATCNLGGIVHANIDSDEQLEEVAYYTLLMIDKCIHLAHYELPHVGYTAKQRMNAGVGIIGLAHLMAKNKKLYTTEEGKKFIHQVAERHAYFLIKASLRLGKELGNAPWMDKTKWPEGWLPIDTYNKNVDGIADFEYLYDWEALRSEIIANKGIRNSCLIAHMPSETSANSSGTTNGLYPIRELTMIKTDNNRVNYWAAPEGEKYEKWYESAWDIPAKDMTDLYAIVQKFTDQGISADFYRKLIGAETVTSTEMISDYLYRVKMGLKTKYYLNSKTSETKQTSNSDDKEFDTYTSDADDDSHCESCTL